MAGRTRGAEALHCGGMVAYAAAAHLAPVETILVSYAALGPLHCLTEWSWLHDRGYGLRRHADDRAWRWPAVALVALAVLAIASRSMLGAEVATLAAVGVAVAGRSGWRIWCAAGAVGGLLALLFGVRYATAPVVALLLLPNVIHILVFTPVFALSGVLRSPSRPAALAMLLWAACLASFAVAPTLGGAAGWAEDKFDLFAGDLLRVSSLGGLGPAPRAVIGAAAFAYGYHYLSWFSAADVVGWRRMPQGRALVVVGAWLLALLSFGVDYRLGFGLTLPLSFGHELMEFPTNVASLRHVGGVARRSLRLRLGVAIRRAPARA